MKIFPNTSTRLYLTFLLGVLIASSSASAADTWQRLFPLYPTHGFNDIYAQATDNVFAVGNSGLIYHYNGTDWAEMTSPVAVDLRAVWGRAANEIFAVGNNGTIIRYNGTDWKQMNSPVSTDLYCVWGFSDSNGLVYAGGRNGEILQYSSGTWTRMETPEYDGIWRYSIIYDIWGTSSNLYAVGWGTDNSTVFDIFLSNTGGNSWVKETGFSVTGFLRPESVLGFAGGDVYIGGHLGVYRLNNGDWGDSQQIVSGDDTYDIWGASQESIWFVGGVRDGGGSLIHYNGNSLSTISTTALGQFTQTSGISGITDADMFVSGDQGLIIHARDKAVSSMTLIPNSPVESICGTSRDALYAVGADGMILSFDGREWVPMQSPTNEYLYSVCGTGSSMFAAGSAGTALYYNGSSWSTISSGTTEPLTDVWCLGGNSAYVVGYNGTVLLCTATECTPETTDGSTDDLFSVYSSEIGTFAGGRAGVVLQKINNTSWVKQDYSSDPLYPTEDISDLWGDTTARTLVTVGGIYVRSFDIDQGSWAKEYESSYTSQSLTSITGSQISDLYVVGYGKDSAAFPYDDGLVLNGSLSSLAEIKAFADQDMRTAWQVSGELFVGTAPSDVTSSLKNMIAHYDGTSWSGMIEKRTISGKPSGSGPDDLYAAGTAGMVMHYDGLSWRSMDTGFLDDLYVSYAAADGQWALAASYDKLIRYDGSIWSEVTLPYGSSLADFWGSGDKVFLVGDNIILSSIDKGLKWGVASIPATTYLQTIWGAGYNGPFFAAGADILTSPDGATWTKMEANNVSYQPTFNALWGSAANDVYAVGDNYLFSYENETEILHYDGSNWKSVFYSDNYFPPQSLTAIWGRSKTDIFAIGSQTLRNDRCSNGWEQMSIPGVPPLEKVWGMEGSNGLYYIFGTADSGREIYQYTSTADRECASPWALFLPAILSRNNTR